MNRSLCCHAEAGLSGIVNGTVGLQAGQTLLIVVGQTGQPSGYTAYGGAGGGATFVLSATQSLIVAGGGAGGGAYGVFWTTCRFDIFSIHCIKVFRFGQSHIFVVAIVESAKHL